VTDYYESLKQQKIICETCTVENVWNAVKCELCEKSLIKDKSENTCPSCTFVNKSNAKECEICREKLLSNAKESKSENTCPSCTFVNKSNAKECEICREKLLSNAKESKTNVKLTMNQGDCFFSSIYRALINQNKYNYTINILNIVYNTTFPEIDEAKIKASENFTNTKAVEKEEEFIQECRRLLSTMKYLDVGLDYLEKNIVIYELLVNEYDGLSDHMKYYIDQRGKEIKKLNTINKMQILKKMKEILKTPAKYVGNEEFSTMRYILSLADIKLIGPFKSLTHLPEKITDDMIVLYNPFDVHYQYIA
jgi:hypothetical protein